MSATSAAEAPGPEPLRVLVPYILSHGGGVRSVLRAGLPRLAVLPGVRVTYAELCANGADMDEMERAGVSVDREAGIPGPGVLSRRAGWRRALDLASQALRLSRMARRLSRSLGEYDVCWVHGHRELLLVLAARALAGRSPKPAVVWHWHGPPLSLAAGREGSWAGRRVAGVASRGCARVIAISDFCAGQAARMGIAPRRLVTVRNAAALRAPGADGPPLPERPEGAFVSLVACAAIRRHKGVHVAVEALRDLPARHVLWIAGDRSDPVAAGYVAELERAAARAGAADRVRFVGLRRDVHRVMAAADAVIVPSLWEEPFGLVAAEAQLLGVPVVASSRGALPEVAGNGRFGLVFDPDRPRELAEAVARLASDPGERARLAAAARRRAEEEYGYDRWCREVVAVLEEAALACEFRSAPAPSRAPAPEGRAAPGITGR